MNLESLHDQYEELRKEEIIKEGDSTSFAAVKAEIVSIYNWESQFYHSHEYRTQLPEETLKRIVAEFDTAMRQFHEVVTLRTGDLSGLAARKNDLIINIKTLYRTLYDLFLRDYRGWQIDNQGSGLEKRLEEITRQAEEGLAQRAKIAEEGLAQRTRENEEKVEQRGDEEVVRIVGTKSTIELAREYKKYIKEDPLVLKKIASIKGKTKSSLKNIMALKNFSQGY
jgi:hypothetical protein